MQAGGKVTAARIADLSGLSLKTVKRRFKTLSVTEQPACQKGSNGPLIRPCGRPLPAASLSSSTTSLNLPSLASFAKATREAARATAKVERPQIAAYRKLAAAMLKRGAEAMTVPGLPPSASVALKDAHKSALAARATAEKRMEARRAGQAVRARKAERESWHADHVMDEAAFKERLADLEGQKAAAVERVLQNGSDPVMMERVEMGYGARFAAEFRARKAARGEPVAKSAAPRRLPRMGQGNHSYDALDLEIEW
jgi:hypothetical protein